MLISGVQSIHICIRGDKSVCVTITYMPQTIQSVSILRCTLCQVGTIPAAAHGSGVQTTQFSSSSLCSRLPHTRRLPAERRFQ